MPDPGVNPYSDSAELGAAYEDGYSAGWADPNAGPPPLPEDAASVWIEGREAGAAARLAEPAPVDPGDGGIGGGMVVNDGAIELAAHVAANALIKAALVATEIASSIAFIAVQVLNMDGRVPEPLPGDWSGPGKEPDVKYFAACSRTDHTQGDYGVQPTGTWGAGGQETYDAANADRAAHGHAEAIVARYSKVDNTCGVVTAA